MAYSNISKGDTGDKVKRIQKHLKHIEYYTGEITGTFDDATENAVKAFQKANNLPETGIVDYKTLSLIAAKSKEAGPIVVKKAEEKPKENTVITTETGRWNNHTFVVASNLIRSFSDLSIKGASELDSKDKDTTGYVTRKGGSPTEVSMTVILNQHTGCEVREEAMKWVEEARNGATDYFYVGNKKLAEYKFMLTSASASKIEISPNGTWVAASLNLTLKQSNGATSSGSSSSGGSGGGGSSGGSGGGGYSGGGSAKYSVNSSSPISTGAGEDTVKTQPQRYNPMSATGFDGKTSSSGTSSAATGTAQWYINKHQATSQGTQNTSFIKNLGKTVTKNSKKTTGTVYVGGGGPRGTLK